MIEKENVDVINDQTEAACKAEEGLQEAVPDKEASTVLGKFKDVDALARAYESLQAEFTRRSQRLRTLEKEAENFKRLEESSGAEKLRKTAKTRRETAKKFDEFVTEVSCSAQKEKPTPFKEAAVAAQTADGGVKPTQERVKVAQEEASLATPTQGQRAAEPPIGYGGESSSAVKNEGEPVTGETLYQRASANEEVRLRIVGEYLASLGKSGVPLTGGSVGVAVTPPSRARSVGQAGDMALLYFRKPAID